MAFMDDALVMLIAGQGSGTVSGVVFKSQPIRYSRKHLLSTPAPNAPLHDIFVNV